MAFLTEQIHIVNAMTSAAGGSQADSDAVSLKLTTGPVIIEVDVQQAASNTVLITPQQCTAVDGTAAKALTVNVPIYVSQDVGGASGDVLTRQADGVNFTTSAAIARKKVRFVIDPATLDLAGGFDCLRVRIGASAAGNLTTANVITAPKYPQTPQASLRVN
jgi:propanediol utilization protein